MTDLTIEACPFCDSEDVDVQCTNVLSDVYAVACQNCGAIGPEVIKGKYQTDAGIAREAVDRWNGPELDIEPIRVPLEVAFKLGEFTLDKNELPDLEPNTPKGEAETDTPESPTTPRGTGDSTDEDPVTASDTPNGDPDGTAALAGVTDPRCEEIPCEPGVVDDRPDPDLHPEERNESDTDEPRESTEEEGQAEESSDDESAEGTTDRVDELRAFLKDNDFTQASFAKCVGVHYTTISQILRRTYPGSDELWTKIDNAMTDVSAGNAKDEETDPEPPAAPITAPTRPGIKSEKDALDFIEKSVREWMDAEDVDAITAARIFEIHDDSLFRVLDWKWPHDFELRRISDHVPAIKEALGVLKTMKRLNKAA